MNLLEGRFIAEGESLPYGWGVSYRTYDLIGARCHRIPLNMIIRYSREVYFWLAGFYPSYTDERFMKWYHVGYDAGYKAGRGIKDEERTEKQWVDIIEKLVNLRVM